VEVVICTAVAAIVMTGLTSVVLTSVRAANTAEYRVQASAQIRNFQFIAYDDFARSSLPTPTGCGTRDNACHTQPLEMTGTQVTNPAQLLRQYRVKYTWRVGSSVLDRQVAATGATKHVANGVTAFSWYVDTSTAPHATVVITMTVRIGSYSDSYYYEQSQTMRFLPQLTP
jgi:hypothetical protein